jgi:DNA-binding GntR family transcriptional regulator
MVRSPDPVTTFSDSRAPKAPIVRLDLNEQAYDVLRERVLTRELGAGERLSLQALADGLGVSRSPVQHALTRLVEDGLVTQTRRGYAVRPVTTKLVQDMHQARVALETFAVGEAAGAIRAGQLDLLRERLAATVAPVSDSRLVDRRAYLVANRAFHEALVDLPGNEVISDLYRRLHVHDLIDRAILGLSTDDAGSSTSEHTEIVDAIAAGDGDRAARAVRVNVATGLRLTLNALERAGGVV